MRVVLWILGRTATDLNIVVGFFAAILGLETKFPNLGTDDIHRLHMIPNSLFITYAIIDSAIHVDGMTRDEAMKR